jgi:hypothetical protein
MSDNLKAPRYRLVGYDIGTAPDENGGWVHWTDHEAIVARLTAERDAALAGAVKSRSTFPILNGNGARIDLQLVIDHGGWAKDNHGQTVNRLAERGGLSWCELYAVLHNKRWEKIDTNEAMIACRAMEARYLAAILARADQIERDGK